MIDFADLTPEELAFRALLERPTAYARWAHAQRAAWARTPAGLEAIEKAPERRAGKHRRRVYVEE